MIIFIVLFNRWGGIVLINPPVEFCKSRKEDQVFKPNESLIAGVFLAHLRLLLGIPDKVTFFRIYDNYNWKIFAKNANVRKAFKILPDRVILVIKVFVALSL